MAKKLLKRDSCPRLEWPEGWAWGGEQNVFYSELLNLLGPAEWVAVVPTPNPGPEVCRRMVNDSDHVLQIMERPPRGVAFLCLWADMPKALPVLFDARLPELTFLAFDKRSDLEEVNASLKALDGSPSLKFLHFDDGVLWLMSAEEEEGD